MRNYKLDKEPFRPGINYKQDALFQAIFEESPDGIFLLHPDNFQILDSNAKAQQLFQVQDKLELTGRQSFSLQESEPVEFSKKIFIDTINSGAEHSQEMAFRSVKGNIFWGRCSIRKVETGQGDIIVFRVRRVVDYLKTAEMLASMVKQTAKATGYEFFDVLTGLLSKTFGVSMTYAARIDPFKGIATTIHCWHKGQETENLEFELETSPSLNVIKGYTTFYPSNLGNMFPDDKFVRRMGMESYMGTPVFNPNGDVCGLLVLMDDKIMEEIPNSRYILSLFASRAGAELERIQSEENYRKQIQALQEKVENKELTGISGS
ncbi:MAG TPA: PAS domain S-box protein [Bacteroidales bacterium]|nr:PAS domain S-box protein [Bacteroidales bacterium]